MTRAEDGTLGQDSVSRRGVVKTLTAGALAGLLRMRPRDAATSAAQEVTGTPMAGASPQQTVPATGQPVPELTAIDAVMDDLLARWQLPGGQLALAKDGHLVLNRGYGLADVERREPVQPTSLFRIASVSKAITAVAVLTLVDAGQLALDDTVFPLLAFAPPPHATMDPRLATITVQDLLVHTGGWDSAQSFDPQGLPFSRTAAAMVGLDDPAEAATIVRFMLGEPLDFAPGTRQAYSNFGFNVLGRVIEHVSGQPYQTYVRDHVLTPVGITGMRLGRTRLADRAPREVRYYAPPGQAPGWSVFWGEGYAPFAYGGSTYLEALDAHGGWIASAADLVRFATAVDGQRGPALLTPETIRAMITTPRPPTEAPGTGYPGITAEVTAGLGWDVIPMAGDVGWSRAGALIGSTAAWVNRRPDGVAIAFAFNSLPPDYNAFLNEAITALGQAVGAVGTWPEGDLFLAEAPAMPEA
ncbi:MAG: beta-lactamase [Thermomicrobiales bacterium]|nr:beta-lactamase [Thermomicrobiales bacterium]